MRRFMRAAALRTAVLCALAALQACGGGGGDDPPPAVTPPATTPAPPTPTTAAPSALSYQSPQVFTVGNAIAALSPTVTGTVTSYSVTPDLPVGLSLDPATGVISGTPTVAAAAANYTITATNAGGNTVFALSLAVEAPAPAPEAPPSALSYATPQTFTLSVPITPLTPTVTGTVTSYTVTPVLPSGLVLDAATGAISGTPTAISAEMVYTVTAANAAGSTTFDVTLATLLERATVDRSDEVTGNQVHVVYVVPADDGYDNRLDELGVIEGSVRSWNNWLAGQTGGPRIRLDTYASGRLDVSFVKLEQPHEELATAALTVRTRLEYLLLAHGFDATNKIYLVYYEGDGDGCGSGAWPPTVHGSSGVLYLRGVGNPDCPPATFVGENDPPGVWEYRGIHEVLHPLGFAPPCAPNQNGNGHVGDSTRDLLYFGTLPAVPPTTLDVNHDDYYTAAVPGCIDLMNSAYLEPLPAGAEEPPGHPYANLTAESCANETSMALAPTATNTTITFVNDYAPAAAPATVFVSELAPGAGGNARTNTNGVPYQQGLTLSTATVSMPKVGTTYVVSTDSATGPCLAIVTATANPGRFVVRAPAEN